MTDIQPPVDEQTTVPQHVIVTLGLVEPIRTYSTSKKKYYDKTTTSHGFVFDNLANSPDLSGETVMEDIRQFVRHYIKAHRSGLKDHQLRYIRVDFQAPHSTIYQWTPKKGWTTK